MTEAAKKNLEDQLNHLQLMIVERFKEGLKIFEKEHLRVFSVDCLKNVAQESFDDALKENKYFRDFTNLFHEYQNLKHKYIQHLVEEMEKENLRRKKLLEEDIQFHSSLKKKMKMYVVPEDPPHLSAASSSSSIHTIISEFPNSVVVQKKNDNNDNNDQLKDEEEEVGGGGGVGGSDEVIVVDGDGPKLDKKDEEEEEEVGGGGGGGSDEVIVVDKKEEEEEEVIVGDESLHRVVEELTGEKNVNFINMKKDQQLIDVEFSEWCTKNKIEHDEDIKYWYYTSSDVTELKYIVQYLGNPPFFACSLDQFKIKYKHEKTKLSAMYDELIAHVLGLKYCYVRSVNGLDAKAQGMISPSDEEWYRIQGLHLKNTDIIYYKDLENEDLEQFFFYHYGMLEDPAITPFCGKNIESFFKNHNKQ